MIVFIHPKTIVQVELSIIALQLSRESNQRLASSTFIDSIEVQPQKQERPKLLTAAGIYKDVREVHFSKLLPSKVSTEEGITIELSDSQLKKHPSGIVFIGEVMSIEFRVEQAEKQ